MPALNLRVKLLATVLLIILAMTAVTVKVGGGLIGERLRAETIAAIGGTRENYLAALEDIASSLTKANGMMAQSPVLRAGTSNDNAPTAAHLIASQMEDTRADTFLWLKSSGDPAVFLRRRGNVGVARLWAAGAAAEPGGGLFDFDDGGDDGSITAFQERQELARLLSTLDRQWSVAELAEASREEPLVQTLARVNQDIRERLQAGKSLEGAGGGGDVVVTWGGRLFLFAYQPLIYDGRNYAGILAAGFEVTDEFASRVASLTRAELAFFRVAEDGSATTLGLGVHEGEGTREGLSRRAKVYGELLRERTLVPGASPRTVEAEGIQYVVQAAEIPVAPGSDRAVVVIAGNLSARLGILAMLNRTLLSVTGFAALLAVVLLGLGMGYWVNRPVEQLAAGMKRIREGDLSCPVEIASRDEMGQLAESYNQMLVELQKKEQYMRMVSKSAVAAVETQVSADLKGSGERRVVTVLFSDIRGFTTLCEGIDPAKLVQLLNRYFDAMVEIIYRHGGLLDKFIGDAIMAIFEGENHPTNAVRAAVEMITECERLDREEELGIKIGVGLHTGDVVAGFVGAKEFMNHTYLGDAVNVAARLEGVSKNGKYTKVILSQATLDEIPGVAEVERLDIEKVKGKTEAVYMYEVVRLLKGRELVAGIQDEDPVKRARAADLLARIGGTETLPQLLELVEDEEDVVAVAALAAIGTLARREPLGDAVVSQLRGLTAGRSDRVRSSLVTTLGCLAGVETLAMLEEYLQDPVPRVRANAIEAMATLRSVTARRRIGPLLDDPNNRVKANAAITLFALDPDGVADKLVQGISNDDEHERASSCYAVCVVAERHPESIRQGSAGSDMDSRSYRLHAAYRRIAGALAAQLPKESDEMVLRNLVPAIHVLFGTETARQMVEDAFDDDGRDRLRESGVLKMSMEFSRPKKPDPDED